jgi:hypothetical protein
VKQAEAQAQVRVLQAKAESDSMQYTLPLKQKQIEQSKLEAEARKEATLQNAQAAAQAKIIDSRAEIERQKNLADTEANRIRVTADADANRIRVTAAADAERMKYEATVLKQNPMLIQKIIAERLSDKLQIMMIPMDGKNFFAADVMRLCLYQSTGQQQREQHGCGRHPRRFRRCSADRNRDGAAEGAGTPAIRHRGRWPWPPPTITGQHPWGWLGPRHWRRDHEHEGKHRRA